MLKTLFNPARFPDESQDSYRARRAAAQRYYALPLHERAGELEFLSWF